MNSNFIQNENFRGNILNLKDKGCLNVIIISLKKIHDRVFDAMMAKIEA